MISPGQDYLRWVREVRDPAVVAGEGERAICHGRYRVSYELAPVPGGWAWRASAQGPDRYSGTPWRGPLPGRDAALVAALEHAVRHFTVDEPDDRMVELIRAERPGQEVLF